VIEENKGCFVVVFTVVNKCFHIWFMRDKIALEGRNLSEHFGIFFLGLPRCLGLLRIEILLVVVVVLSLICKIPQAKSSQG